MKNNKLRFGIVGTNFISDWFIAGARQDERFELSAVYSRAEDTASAFASKHGIAHIFTSLEEMAASSVIDAVYIASPNFLHASQSILCMRNGKHVLCEKPFAANAAEAKSMINAANHHNVTLMEAMKPTLTPNFSAVMNNLPRIGKVRRYFASYCQYSSRYDRFKEGIILNAFRPDYANGALMDIGIYTIYPMVVLFGRPDGIDASGVMLSSGVDGQGAINFNYSSGMNATVLYSKIADSALPAEIQGEDGFITLDRINTISRVTLAQRRQAASGKGLPPENIDISIPASKDEYFYEANEFISLVLSGKRESAVNSHENSTVTMEIMDEVRCRLGVIYPSDQVPAEDR